jgi:hypothetical protein
MNTLKQIVPMIAAAGVLLLTFGCTSTPTYKQGFDFSQYRTFALLPLPEGGSYQDPAIVNRLGPPAQESIVETLAAKGFKQTKESEADFLVKLQFDYQEEQGRHEQRMFEIHMLDAKSKEVVWSKYYQRTTDSTHPVEVVRQIVAKMLKFFPPGSKQPGP